MRRADLEHVLRAASEITGDPDVLVIGSQSILGAIDEGLLPAAAVESREVDVAFFNDPGGLKADLVDGAIGEYSAFDETHGFYAQGVDTTTATLPHGWWDRLVAVENTNTGNARGRCLEPHDCAVSKLVAGREKDFLFVGALLDAGLIHPDVLAERVDGLDVSPALLARMRGWITARR